MHHFEWCMLLNLIWCYDGREASPPVHKLRMSERAVVPTGRVSQVDVVGVATEYYEKVTTGVLFRRETNNYGSALLGDVDDIIEREFVAPGRLEAKLGNGAFD